VAVSRALRRLLRIRNLEEEQSRIALESAVGDLRRLEHAQAATVERDRRGRRLFDSSVHTGDLPDRLAGVVEQHAADCVQRALAPRIRDAALDVAGLREDYLDRRVERRQAETLVKESEARDALDLERKSQQGLDDWFRNRLHRAKLDTKDAQPADSAKAFAGLTGRVTGHMTGPGQAPGREET
jgi:hypothetical protein